MRHPCPDDPPVNRELPEPDLVHSLLIEGPVRMPRLLEADGGGGGGGSGVIFLVLLPLPLRLGVDHGERLLVLVGDEPAPHL